MNYPISSNMRNDFNVVVFFQESRVETTRAVSQRGIPPKTAVEVWKIDTFIQLAFEQFWPNMTKSDHFWFRRSCD